MLSELRPSPAAFTVLSQCLGLGPILKLFLFNKKEGVWLPCDKQKMGKDTSMPNATEKKSPNSLMLLLCQLGLLAVEVVIGSGS